MLSPESPLEKLPADLPRRQILFFDAIAHSLRSVDRSYTHLQQLLLAGALGDDRPLGLYAGDEKTRVVDALMAAWAMVDALHRLRELVTRMPGLKKNRPEVQLYLRTIGEVEDLRHAVQHLAEHLGESAEMNRPAWGSLAWVVPISESKVASSVLVPGHIVERMSPPLVNPVGQRVESPVDHVSLTAASKTVDLSNMYRGSRRFAQALENAAQQSFASRAQDGTRALLHP